MSFRNYDTPVIPSMSELFLKSSSTPTQARLRMITYNVRSARGSYLQIALRAMAQMRIIWASCWKPESRMPSTRMTAVDIRFKRRKRKLLLRAALPCSTNRILINGVSKALGLMVQMSFRPL